LKFGGPVAVGTEMDVVVAGEIVVLGRSARATSMTSSRRAALIAETANATVTKREVNMA
jgi:hypothetical protein